VGRDLTLGPEISRALHTCKFPSRFRKGNTLAPIPWRFFGNWRHVCRGPVGRQNAIGLAALATVLVGLWVILGGYGLNGDRGLSVQTRLVILAFTILVLVYRLWDALDDD
jgi:hypothetical protein